MFNKKIIPLPDKFKHNIVLYFTIFFYLLAVYKWMNGMWLYQMQPNIFHSRFDGFTWMFMQTGLHQWLLNNKDGWLLLDTLFYSVPLVYFLSHNVWKTGSRLIAIFLLLINWIYVQCYTLYPTNSIEAHISWLLFPIAFLSSNPKTFRLLFEGLRYFFLFFFVSAGLWKIVTGSVFNTEQMSGILLYQHADLLLTSRGYWQTEIILWLIDQSTIGFFLYLSATILELVFIVGFFTKKYDHLLIFAAILFLLFDQLIMRIPYYEILPFLITLRIGAMRQDLPSYVVQPRNHIQS